MLQFKLQQLFSWWRIGANNPPPVHKQRRRAGLLQQLALAMLASTDEVASGPVMQL